MFHITKAKVQRLQIKKDLNNIVVITCLNKLLKVLIYINTKFERHSPSKIVVH